MTFTADPAHDYDEHCYRQWQQEQEAHQMMLADVATVSTVVEVVELCRPMLPELVYRSLLRFAEETDASIDDHWYQRERLKEQAEEAERLMNETCAHLDDLRALAAQVRIGYDLTDNEAARLLIHEIEGE